jgi:hypothetical protein
MKRAIIGMMICMLVIFSSFSIVTASDENTPPNIPSEPNPSDGAIDIGKKTHLSWRGGDPDPGDKAIYDVYFGTNLDPDKIASDLQMPNFKPNTLDNFTQYYWYVVAKDENGAITPGPLWTFTTNDCEHDPPHKPSGPSRVRNRHRYEYNTKTKNQNHGGYYYNFSWGDGNNTGWLGPYQHNERVRAEHQWEKPGMYQVQARYRFQNGYRDEFETGWSEPLIVTVTSDDPNNNPPNKPTISGPTGGSPNVDYDFTFRAIDPEEDDIYVYIEFCADCQEAQWYGPFKSGEEFVITHAWEYKGTFTIRSRAKDVYEEEGDWSEFKVTMPRYRSINGPLLKILENCFNLFPLLRIVLERLY